LRTFEGAHKGAVSENVGSHPNGFFTSSQQYAKDVKKNEDKKASSVSANFAAAKDKDAATTTPVKAK